MMWKVLKRVFFRVRKNFYFWPKVKIENFKQKLNFVKFLKFWFFKTDFDWQQIEKKNKKKSFPTPVFQLCKRLRSMYS